MLHGPYVDCMRASKRKHLTHMKHLQKCTVHDPVLHQYFLNLLPSDASRKCVSENLKTSKPPKFHCPVAQWVHLRGSLNMLRSRDVGAQFQKAQERNIGSWMTDDGCNLHNFFWLPSCLLSNTNSDEGPQRLTIHLRRAYDVRYDIFIYLSMCSISIFWINTIRDHSCYPSSLRNHP